MKRTVICVVAVLLAGCVADLAVAAPVGSAWTYQGKLVLGELPVNGTADFQFSLWDAAGTGAPPSGGVQVGSTLAASNVNVVDGVFTVELDFGANAFNGNARWLQIAVASPSGGGLTTLAPRQALTAVPYAQTSQTAVTSLDAWHLGGNLGTTGGTHFLGTTDNQPLVLKANNQRGLQIQYALNSNYWGNNLLGGYWLNSITAGVTQATVFGGGRLGITENFNQVTDHGGTVSGGIGNRAGNANADVFDAYFATVGGGYQNTAGGAYATVPGGVSNNTAGYASFAAGNRAKANHDGSFVWNDTSTIFDLASTAANQFLIRAGGGVGINTNAPNSLFAVQGSNSSALFRIGGPGGDGHHVSSGRDFVFNATGGQFSFRSIGNINNLSSFTDQLILHPNGDATLRGFLFNFSDARYKTHVSTIPDALDTVSHLRGVTYEWDQARWPDRDSADGRQIGFIAQEVEKVLPELVYTDADGYKSVSYVNVVPVLVEAVKQQQDQRAADARATEAKLRQKDAEIAELRAKLDLLAEAVAELKSGRQ